MDTEWTYIGDGVYVKYDGFHIVLKTDDNTIYLEDGVFNSMIDWLKRKGIIEVDDA